MTRAAFYGAIVAALLAAGDPAGASGFLLSKFGGDLGYPHSTGAVAIFWNPAAMAARPGTNVLLENSLILRHIDYERTEADVDDASNLGKAELDNVVPLPFFAATSDLGLEDAAFGVGVYVPFGTRSVWNDAAGPQRWSSINGSIYAMYVTAGAAYQLPGRVSIGATVSYVHTTITTLRASSTTLEGMPDLNGDPDAPVSVTFLDDPATEGRVLVDVADDGVTGSAGVFWEPIAGRLSLGLSYHAPVEVRGEGTYRNAYHVPTADGQVEEKRRARLDNTFPDAVHFGVLWWPTPDLGLRAGISWIHWSLFDVQRLTVDDGFLGERDLRQDLPRDYHDAWIVRGGAQYRLLDWLQVYLGGGWDQSPIPPETLDATLFDADKIGISAGLLVDVGEHVQLAAGYDQIFCVPVEVDESDHRPSAAGKYDCAFQLIASSVELSF